MVAGLANTKVTCSAIELIRINIPYDSNQTCGEYLKPHQDSNGGYVDNPTDRGECLFCPTSEVNAVLNGFGINTQHTWRNAGLMAVYVCLNIAATFVLYRLTHVRAKAKAQ